MTQEPVAFSYVDNKGVIHEFTYERLVTPEVPPPSPVPQQSYKIVEYKTMIEAPFFRIRLESNDVAFDYITSIPVQFTPDNATSFFSVVLKSNETVEVWGTNVFVKVLQNSNPPRVVASVQMKGSSSRPKGSLIPGTGLPFSWLKEDGRYLIEFGDQGRSLIEIFPKDKRVDIWDVLLVEIHEQSKTTRVSTETNSRPYQPGGVHKKIKGITI